MTVQQRVNKVLANFNPNNKELSDDENFIDALGLDSLDVVEFIMNIEDEFQLEIDDVAAEKITCLNDIYDYVNARI